MPSNDEQLRAVFAEKLSFYRKRSGLTQYELAEKLNYSDKSVSKWERGEGLPDLYVILQIANLFGVGINDLISKKTASKIRRFSRNKFIITVLALCAPWLIAAILFSVFGMILPKAPAWLGFIYAIPVFAVIAIVFTALWWGRKWCFVAVSSLIWSIACCVTVSLQFHRSWNIFIIAAVLQIMTFLGFLIKPKK